MIETYHANNPNGETNGAKIWTGDLPGDAKTNPQTLEIAFDQPQMINKVLLRGVRADNQFSALLDYDLQYQDGANWKTIETIRRPMPPSEEARTADATNAIWMDDTNFFHHQFAPITTNKLRLVVRDVSHGFVPDDRTRAWGNLIPQKLMLREIGVYAPTLPVTIAALPGATANTLNFQISNTGRQMWRGQLRAFAPSGWNLMNPNQVIEVPANNRKTVTLQLTPPGEMPAGSSWVDVQLLDAKGALMASSFDAIRVAAPLEVAPLTAPPAQNGAQTLQANLKNIGTAPLSGFARVRLTGIRAIAPIEVPFGPIAPGQTARVDWNVPGVDPSKERFNATYEIVANGIVTRAEQDLARQQWMVLGPFPREFETDFGPEKGVDLSKGYTDRVGQENKWFAALPNAEGMVNLADIIKANTEKVAYAYAVVNSPRAQKAIFSVGTDDGGKGWINGQQVYSDDAGHAAAPGQTKIPVELKAGRNEILLKVTQGTGGWGFYFDLLDPQTGKPLSDIIYTGR